MAYTRLLYLGCGTGRVLVLDFGVGRARGLLHPQYNSAGMMYLRTCRQVRWSGQERWRGRDSGCVGGTVVDAPPRCEQVEAELWQAAERSGVRNGGEGWWSRLRSAGGLERQLWR